MVLQPHSLVFGNRAAKNHKVHPRVISYRRWQIRLGENVHRLLRGRRKGIVPAARLVGHKYLRQVGFIIRCREVTQLVVMHHHFAGLDLGRDSRRGLVQLDSAGNRQS